MHAIPFACCTLHIAVVIGVQDCTYTHPHRRIDSCLYIHIDSCIRTGHAESLYISMRDPAVSFSARAKKTNKGSPPPTGREEACTWVLGLPHSPISRFFFRVVISEKSFIHITRFSRRMTQL